eukprot:TRINITY_DN12391_c0_g1_i2.p1 TRINITY_DN12391_c0_g1~~TRINITY_DN12391_c0_g1_i2.p1  ORF type:complete len:232 (-),score=9.66 TRINITY_DN12391_c0_g1_i2:149-844(-)
MLKRGRENAGRYREGHIPQTFCEEFDIEGERAVAMRRGILGRREREGEEKNTGARKRQRVVGPVVNQSIADRARIVEAHKAAFAKNGARNGTISTSSGVVDQGGPVIVTEMLPREWTRQTDGSSIIHKTRKVLTPHTTGDPELCHHWKRFSAWGNCTKYTCSGGTAEQPCTAKLVANWARMTYVDDGNHTCYYVTNAKGMRVKTGDPGPHFNRSTNSTVQRAARRAPQAGW